MTSVADIPGDADDDLSEITPELVLVDPELARIMRERELGVGSRSPIGPTLRLVPTAGETAPIVPRSTTTGEPAAPEPARVVEPPVEPPASTAAAPTAPAPAVDEPLLPSPQAMPAAMPHSIARPERVRRPVRERGRGPGRGRGALAFIVAVAVASVATLAILNFAGGSSTSSAPTMASISGGPTSPATPKPAAAVPPIEARRFAWAPVDGAVSYHVELFRGADRVLAKETTEPILELEPTWRYEGKTVQLAPGTYRWYVWPVTKTGRATQAVVRARLDIP